MAMRAFEQPGATRPETTVEPAARPIALPGIASVLTWVEALLVVATAVATLQFTPSHGGYQWLAECLMAVLAASLISFVLSPLTARTLSEQLRRGLSGATRRTLVVGLGNLFSVAGLQSLAVGVTVSGLDWVAAWGGLMLSALLCFYLGLWLFARRVELLERGRRRVAVFGQGQPLEDYLAVLANLRSEARLVVACTDLSDQAMTSRGVRADWPPIPASRLDMFLNEARHHDLDEIVLCLEPSHYAVLRSQMTALGALPVRLSLFMGRHNSFRASEHTSARVKPETLVLSTPPLTPAQTVIKRATDIIGAGSLLLILAPFLALLALLIKLDSPGPVFFSQPRRGYNQFIFRMLKFRTMRADHGDQLAEVLTTRADPRVTRVGRFMRRTSLDELPQLLNVMRGEMSLVGPRPHPLLAKAGTTLYHEVLEEYAFRSRMKPGMTGWAQIHGWRGTTETEEQLINRIRYDLEYVDHWSPRLDLYILWRTLFVCAEGENAY